MLRLLSFAATALATTFSASFPAHAQMPDGEAAFAICSSCHGTSEGERKMGPTLAGIIGRQAGSIEGYAYSPAMREAGFAWTEDTLDAFLKAPSEKVPGTKMTFGAVADDEKRAALIAYLATLQ